MPTPPQNRFSVSSQATFTDREEQQYFQQCAALMNQLIALLNKHFHIRKKRYN